MAHTNTAPSSDATPDTTTAIQLSFLAAEDAFFSALAVLLIYVNCFGKGRVHFMGLSVGVPEPYTENNYIRNERYTTSLWGLNFS